jgi:predicted TIM-barrel fold metal-dependent hydrolase
MPAGSCDTHLHVFGERDRYPLDPRRSYTPHAATLRQYRAVMHACGIDRAVLVQPSVYGNDNRCLLDALREAATAGDLRGIVVPDAGATDDELLAMHALGVRGIRLNLVNPQVLGIESGLAISARMRTHGWHLQVQLSLQGDGAATLGELARRSDVPLVVDHFGRPAPGAPAHPLLLELLRSGRAWVKLSAPYRVSRDPQPPHADLAPLVEALAAANPDRLLWASDWPHTELAATPHVADLVDALATWLPDPALRQRVCVDNPAQLYDFRGSP